MPFNINSLKTNIRDYGYLSNNKFAVLVQTPPILTNALLGNQGTGTSMNQIAQNMSFRIDQIRAPGISIASSDVARYGIGPTQKQPLSAQYQELFFSILCDQYSEIWQYWYNWSRLVFEYNGTSSGSAPSYTANYKKDYSSVVQLQIYDYFGNIIQKINTFETFPTAIREVPLSWGDGNLMKLNVAMAFTEYTIEGSTIQTQTAPQNQNLMGGRQTVGIGTGYNPVTNQ